MFIKCQGIISSLSLLSLLITNIKSLLYYSEILFQLAGVAAQVNRFENEPELYQSLLDEWNENFPPSLGASGTPKAVAAMLSKQSIQLIDLKEQIQTEQKRREIEVAEVMRSMDAQLSISRKCVVVERKQLAVSYQLEKERLEQLIAEADTKLNNVVDAVKEVITTTTTTTTTTAAITNTNTNTNNIAIFRREKSTNH